MTSMLTTLAGSPSTLLRVVKIVDAVRVYESSWRKSQPYGSIHAASDEADWRCARAEQRLHAGEDG